MDLSAIYVHYHTPDLLVESVASMLADAGRAGLELEVLVVDNGSSPEGRRRLRATPVRLLEPGENLGYAGGLELGVREARGKILCLANPDVLLEAGALGALAEELERGADAAGPRFFWDRGHRLLLPPTEERTTRAELLRHLAPASPTVARAARRRWRRRARRVWGAEEPLAGSDLSGAFLAVRRESWERIGPFDAGYRLYFEESDWLLRLERAGGVACHVPAARAVHLFDRSGAVEPRSRTWFDESRRRFARRWYPGWARRVAQLADRLPRRPEPEPPLLETPADAATPPELPLSSPEPVWVEISPSPAGVPAAAERVEAGRGTWRLPEEVWQRLEPGEYRVRTVGVRGDERSVHRLVKLPSNAEERGVE